MENIYKLRDELMKQRLNNQTEFKINSSGTIFNIDDFINEIDNLRLCVCPPKN